MSPPAPAPRPVFVPGSLVGVLTGAVAVNVAVLLGVGLALDQSVDDLLSARQRTLHLVELRGQIAHYDEVLTMSARMAAASGDPAWEARYHRYEPVLEEVIAEAERLVPSAGGAALTEDANEALVAMELSAFELVQQGHPEEAAALLAGPDYERHKSAYSRGLDAFMNQVESELDAVVSRQERQNRAARLGALLGLGLLVGGWVLLLRRIGRWRAQLLDAEAQVQDTLAQQEERVARRTRDLRASRDALRRLAEDLLNAEAAERQRLALVLHDDLQQLLVAGTMRLEAVQGLPPTAAEDVAAAREAVRRAMQVSRRLTSELAQVEADRPLASALEELVGALEERHGLQVHLDCPEVVCELAPSVKRFVLRAVRELLFNVVKHSGEREAWVEVVSDAVGLDITVRDQGRGFSSAMEEDPPTGLGLSAIRKRTAWLGGEFDLHRGHGGARVRLQVPATPSDRALEP